MLRDVPAFGAWFFTYEYLKAWLAAPGRKPGVVAQLLSGGVAGCASWLISFPADVIKSRVQTMPEGLPAAQYRVGAVARTILRASGWRCVQGTAHGSNCCSLNGGFATIPSVTVYCPGSIDPCHACCVLLFVRIFCCSPSLLVGLVITHACARAIAPQRVVSWCAADHCARISCERRDFLWLRKISRLDGQALLVVYYCNRYCSLKSGYAFHVQLLSLLSPGPGVCVVVAVMLW